VLGLGLVLAGCGNGFSGEFQDEMGVTRYEFNDDGRVYMSVMGIEAAGEYELDGKRVVVKGPNGTMVLNREGDDLVGPMGLKLTRQE
ncbi:MAG: hypothetical protein P8080_13045, partial [Gammaproteobacteria bacterium]